MSDILEVTLPEYWALTGVRPRGFAEFCDMFEATKGPLGLWEFVLRDEKTGDTKRIWTKNIVTDNGALGMLKNTWNNAGSVVAIFNQIAIDANVGSSTLTTALTNGQTGIVSLAVAALPAAIPATTGGVATTLTVGYGGASTQTVTVASAASQGATSISVNSFTSNANYAIGANVVPNVATGENPSSVTGAQYSGALGSGAFTFSGAGAGNRQVVISFTYAAGSFTAGNYTSVWTTNANPIVAGATATHLTTSPMAYGSSTSLTINITEKI